MLRVSLVLIVVAGAVYTLCMHGMRVKRCGQTTIHQHASCNREGRLLTQLAQRCHQVLNHRSIRDTEWVKRVQTRWDGTIHQLVDRGGGKAPAVTTHKRDIRVCLDPPVTPDALLFVALHELSHVAVDSQGHTREFWTCFRAFMDAAIQGGGYTHRADATVCGSPLGSIPGREDF